jgi:hypothetical protein
MLFSHVGKTLLEKGVYSDCTVRINGVEFKLHKHILAERSGYFEALFSCGDTGAVGVDTDAGSGAIVADIPGRTAKYPGVIADLVVRCMYEQLDPFAPEIDAKHYVAFLEAVNFLGIKHHSFAFSTADIARRSAFRINANYNKRLNHFAFVAGHTGIVRCYPYVPLDEVGNPDQTHKRPIPPIYLEEIRKLLVRLATQEFGLEDGEFVIETCGVEVYIDESEDGGDEPVVTGGLINGYYFQGSDWGRDFVDLVLRTVLPDSMVPWATTAVEDT